MGAKALRNPTAWLALLTNHFAASLAPALQLASNMLSPDRDIISNSPENSMALRSFRQLLVVFLFTGTLWAATDPFAGTWKLDPAKSKLTDQMKVEAAGPNKYTFIFSGRQLRDHSRRRHRSARYLRYYLCSHRPVSEPMEGRAQDRWPRDHLRHLGSLA